MSDIPKSCPEQQQQQIYKLQQEYLLKHATFAKMYNGGGGGSSNSEEAHCGAANSLTSYANIAAATQPIPQNDDNNNDSPDVFYRGSDPNNPTYHNDNKHSVVSSPWTNKNDAQHAPLYRLGNWESPLPQHQSSFVQRPSHLVHQTLNPDNYSLPNPQYGAGLTNTKREYAPQYTQDKRQCISSDPSVPKTKEQVNGDLISKPAGIRRGKWSVEEEEYATRYILYFSSGLLTLPEGKTIRASLAEKLSCDPMRITKKYAGISLSSFAKSKLDRQKFSPEEVNMAKIEIERLERRFHLRLAQGLGPLPKDTEQGGTSPTSTSPPIDSYGKQKSTADIQRQFNSQASVSSQVSDPSQGCFPQVASVVTNNGTTVAAPPHSIPLVSQPTVQQQSAVNNGNSNNSAAQAPPFLSAYLATLASNQQQAAAAAAVGLPLPKDTQGGGGTSAAISLQPSVPPPMVPVSATPPCVTMPTDPELLVEYGNKCLRDRARATKYKTEYKEPAPDAFVKWSDARRIRNAEKQHVNQHEALGSLLSEEIGQAGSSVFEQRKSMYAKIVRILYQQKSTLDWTAKIPKMATEVEASLYRSASTFEVYNDDSTLRQRMQDLLISIRGRNQQNSTTAVGRSSSSAAPSRQHHQNTAAPRHAVGRSSSSAAPSRQHHQNTAAPRRQQLLPPAIHRDPWRRTVFGESCPRCGHQGSLGVSWIHRSKCAKCLCPMSGKWRSNDQTTTFHSNHSFHDPPFMRKARLLRHNNVIINMDSIISGEGELFIKNESEAEQRRHHWDILLGEHELTSHEMDRLNIARIEMSAYGSLLVNGEKERVKPVYAHRVNLNVSQSHQVCSIMKDSTISPEEKEERCHRLIQDSEEIDIPPHTYYISDRCRAFTVRKGIVRAVGRVDTSGYSIVSLYDTNGVGHNFKRGQLARITFEGLPLVPGDCTIHHKNYRRRDDSLGNTSFTHISPNAADKGPRLHPSGRQMNQEQREQQEEAAVERENRRLLMIRLNKLLQPLSPADQARVHDALNGAGPNNQILAQHGGESVTRGSMRRLRPGIWLNDLSINYYLKNCLAMRDVQLCTTQPGRKRSHFFNSFFMYNMFLGNDGNYNGDNLNRYFRKVPGRNIFDLRYLVCPINIDNEHWTAIIVFMEKKEIRYYDSLGGTDYDKLDGVLNYLCDEHHGMTGGFLDTDEWELFECTDNVPRQLNGCDCGVFVCMICDFISNDCELVFEQHHIDQCREKIAHAILTTRAIDY